MFTIQYNKLVGDRIPEIIEASSKRCVCSILSDEEYLAKLDEKLNEDAVDGQITEVGVQMVGEIGPIADHRVRADLTQFVSGQVPENAGL